MSSPADRSHALRLLAEELRVEIQKLDETLVECNAALERFKDRDPDRLELLGSAALIHGFYNGVERALTRIAPELNGGLPSGGDWHRRLLEQMTVEVPSIRPAVLSSESASQLDEYRAFRHRFRNLYFFDIRWDRVRDLLSRATDTWKIVRADLEGFVSFLQRLGEAGEA